MKGKFLFERINLKVLEIIDEIKCLTFLVSILLEWEYVKYRDIVCNNAPIYINFNYKQILGKEFDSFTIKGITLNS